MQKENRNSIQGYVRLKRKDIWVKRYARVDVEERCFSYKNNSKNTKIRHSIHLGDGAKIKRSKTENIIYIEKGTNCDRSSTDGVRLHFSRTQELEEWLQFLITAQKGGNYSMRSTQGSTAERAKEQESSDISPVESQSSMHKNPEFQIEQMVDDSVLKKEQASEKWCLIRNIAGVNIYGPTSYTFVQDASVNQELSQMVYGISILPVAVVIFQQILPGNQFVLPLFLILFILATIYSYKSFIDPAKSCSKKASQESFKLLTVIKDTDPDEIYRVLSDPQVRKNWDIGLKNAELVNSHTKGQLIRLEYLDEQQASTDISLKLIHCSPEKSYIVEDPLRIWVLHTLKQGGMRVEIIQVLADEAQMTIAVEKINAIKLMLSLQDDPCQADSSESEDELIDSQLFKSSLIPHIEEQDTVMEDPIWHPEVVEDWQERIKEYSPKQLKFYDKMLGKLDDLIKLGEKTTGWQLLVDDKKQDIKIEAKISDEGLQTMRSSGWIEFSALDLWRCLHYVPVRKEWDPDFDILKYVRKIGAGSYNVHNRTRKIMVVAGRDFALNLLTFKRPDGVIFNVISSNQDLYDEFPVQNGVVRAESPVGGWIMKPDPNNPQRCFAQLILELDFGGSMPSFAVKQAFRSQGYQLNKIKKAIPKMYKHYYQSTE